MPSCKFFKPMPDGCYGWCCHPAAQPGDQCIYNSGEDVDCIIREPIMTSMQLTKDTLDRLRAFGYPAEKALIKVLDIVESLPEIPASAE